MDKIPFEVRFKELQGRFLGQIADDEGTMQKHFSALIAQPAYEEPRRMLTMLVHKYHGNGLTFGFPAISHAAGLLEAELDNVSSAETLLAALPKIEQLFATLMKTLRTPS